MSSDTDSSMPEPLSTAVLDRVLSGHPASGDAERVAAWLAGAPEREAIFSALRGVGPATADTRHDAEVALQQLTKRLQALESPNRTARTINRTESRSWRVALGAVAVLGFIALVPIFRTFVRHGPPPITRMYATSRGQQVAVDLPDGSHVMLAPETQLRFVRDARGARSVDLVGEAFFSVAPGATHPFVVRTGVVATRVLGTAFDVRAYPDDRVTRVSVTTGRVSVGGHMTPVILTAGMAGRITDSSATISVGDDPALATSWTQGRLVFRNTPVGAMLATLGRWYGYEFRLSDTVLTSSHVSAVFDIRQPMQALKTVKAVLGVSMTFDGNVVTLRPKHDQRGAVRETQPRPARDNPESEVGK